MATGSAADRAIVAFRPDLVVLDLVLPDVHGFEVARKLAAAETGARVIFLSESDAIADKVAALAAGDDYVTRPFTPAEIVARVRAVLRRAGGS